MSGRRWVAAQRLPWQLTSSPLARRPFQGWPWNALGPRAWHREEQDQRRDSAVHLPGTVGPDAVLAVKEHVAIAARSRRGREQAPTTADLSSQRLKEAFETASDN